MYTRQTAASLLLMFFITVSNAQHLALTIEDAEKQGILISQLDSIYKSGIHSDSTLAVFKTESEQQALGTAYVILLQDFGKFLSKNNFKWERLTRGFNRIYFDKDGSIDYFLYNFQKPKPGEELSPEKQAEFNRLLNLFIRDYKISIKAGTKFSQCSPTKYTPSEAK